MAARTLYTAGITGVGMSFPERRLTNADLEKMVETNDEWIVDRTGIRERRIADKGIGASHHGTLAAQQAMEHAGITGEDVDLIIVPTVTPDMVFPATACIIQEKIGARNAWGLRPGGGLQRLPVRPAERPGPGGGRPRQAGPGHRQRGHVRPHRLHRPKHLHPVR